METGDIAIEGGYIVGIGNYEGITEKDLGGAYVCPGFLDGHIHIESSMTPQGSLNGLLFHMAPLRDHRSP